jgi:two-component system cell cycle sensor histidine kinase/response regulator CckA
MIKLENRPACKYVNGRIERIYRVGSQIKIKTMQKQILVVDNHPAMLKAMSNLLEKEGHQVRAVDSGLAASEILRNYTPDVIITDLEMPNINGEKLCRIIRSMPGLRDVQIIILSAIAADKNIDFAEFGADACIAKGPINQIKRHVLDVLEELDCGGFDCEAGKIRGIDNACRQQITKELLSSKGHFEAIINNMSEGILELTSDSRIVSANPNAISLAEISEEKLLGSKFIDLFEGEHQQRIKSILENIDELRQIIPEDSPVKLNDKLVLLNFIPIKDAADESIIIIVTDVSEKKQIEEQLLQAQKMEAVGTLAGGIAHDFNNLMMVMQGNVSLMLMALESDHPHFEPLRNIEQQISSGTKLTSQMLAYTSQGKYEIQHFDLNNLIEATSDAFGRMRKDITVERNLATDLFAIQADKAQIELVLLNLYINAADAMPDGGKLMLQTSNVSRENMPDKIYEPKTANYVQLTITDTGVGMNKETRERVFEPFFTTKTLGKGTGLGLASTYGVIKGHKGYIEVDSESGCGTTFRIYLPASGAIRPKSTKPAENLVKGDATILLIDDEETVLNIGVKILEKIGYHVHAAEGGQEAIQIYEKEKDKIDMVILDMIMPDMSGGAVYDRIKAINPKAKVLLSSGYSRDGQAMEILNRGCNGFIQKPFTIKELSAKISDILAM